MFEKLNKLLRCCSMLSALVFVPLPALADGNKLLENCKAAVTFMESKQLKDEFKIGVCFGMIQGVRNTMINLNNAVRMEYQLCWPENGISNGQAARIVVKYLEENPADLHKDEVLLAMGAFVNAYRCAR